MDAGGAGQGIEPWMCCAVSAFEAVRGMKGTGVRSLHHTFDVSRRISLGVLLALDFKEDELLCAFFWV